MVGVEGFGAGGVEPCVWQFDGRTEGEDLEGGGWLSRCAWRLFGDGFCS